MLKISVEIKEKDGEASSVTVKVPKDASNSKATDNEKQTASVVYNAICEALGKLK